MLTSLAVIVIVIVTSLPIYVFDKPRTVLSTHSRHMIGSQKSVFGVPCPELKE